MGRIITDPAVGYGAGLGLIMGLDLAFGPVDPIIYFQFGSAWFRP